MLTGDTTNPPNSNASPRASEALWGIWSLSETSLKRPDTNPTTPCDVSHGTQARMVCNPLQSSQRKLWGIRQRARGWLTNVTLSLSGLFPLSDLWYSSQAPSHRPSTFEPCVLLMPLSRTWTASKLCRWLGGNAQKIRTPYSIQSHPLSQ